MKQITKTFLKGLLAVVPITLSLYLLYWLAVTAELVLGDIFKLFLPNQWYLPGLGFVAGVIAIFFVGTSLQAKMIHRIFHRLEQRVIQIPVFKSIYIAIRDLVSMFSSDARKEFSQVVLVDMPAIGGKQIGFVTRHDFSEFPGALDAENQIAVFVPFSYQIGGFTVMIPPDRIVPLEMSVEDALRFVATAGIVGHAKQGKPVDPGR